MPQPFSNEAGVADALGRPPGACAATRSGRLFARWALAVVAAATLVHVWIGAQLTLSVDEAQYALYGLHPAWSYFDHPPMVGWLQWLALRLGSDELVLRLWPIALFVAVALLLFGLARRAAPAFGADPDKAGSIAVLLAAGMPALQVLGIGLVPDLPLAVCALALAWPLSRLARSDGAGSGRLAAWLTVGALLGLAGLCKYTAVLLPVGLLGFIAWERRWHWLAEPGPWLASVVALALVTPVLYWNARHGWASLAYQSNHVGSGAWHLRNLAVFALGQVVAYSPIVAAAVWHPIVRAREPLPRLLACLGLPVLLAGAISGGTAASLPHWTLTGWLLLVPLAAGRLAAPASRAIRLTAGASALVSIVLVGGIFGVLALRPVERLPAIKPAVEGFMGWKQAAEAADRLRKRYFPNEPKATIMVNNWTYASRLAWYARPAAVQLNDSRRSQFDFWFGKPSGPGILVVPVADDGHLNLKLERPMNCRFLEQSAWPPATPVSRFRFYRCTPPAQVGERG